MWISRTTDIVQTEAEYARQVQKKVFVNDKLESLLKENPNITPEIVNNVEFNYKKGASKLKNVEDVETYSKSLHDKLQLLKEKSLEILKITEKLEAMKQII